MKTGIKYLSFLLVIITIFSCEITEKISIDENGSGTYTLSMDMSDMLNAVDQMKDSVTTGNAKEKMEVIDTIINLKDLIDKKNDSIVTLSKEDQQIIESIKDFKIHLMVNEATKKLVTEIFYDFNKVDDLENIQERVTKAQSIQDKKGEQTPTSDTKLSFTYDGKKFSRKVISKNLSQEEKDAYKKYMEKNSNFLDGSSYHIEYQFPRAIKSTTYKEATFSADRKTLFIKTDLKTISQNPTLLDFDVILE